MMCPVAMKVAVCLAIPGPLLQSSRPLQTRPPCQTTQTPCTTRTPIGPCTSSKEHATGIILPLTLQTAGEPTGLLVPRRYPQSGMMFVMFSCDLHSSLTLLDASPLILQRHETACSVTAFQRQWLRTMPSMTMDLTSGQHRRKNMQQDVHCQSVLKMTLEHNLTVTVPFQEVNCCFVISPNVHRQPC